MRDGERKSKVTHTHITHRTNEEEALRLELGI